MPSVKLHTSSNSTATVTNENNPLPPLLQTPHGLAIIEIQGTLNTPTSGGDGQNQQPLPIGRLHFPDQDAQDGQEQRKEPLKVHLYVGKSQRLVGEVRKLAKPLAVVAKRKQNEQDQHQGDGSEDVATAPVELPEGSMGEELEIVDIVRHKLFFGGRPEFV